MSNSNSSDFKKLAAEADNEREKEIKSRKEAQLLKMEVDRQNNEDDETDKVPNAANISDSTFSSKYTSRTSSVEMGTVDARIRLLEDHNRSITLDCGRLLEEKEMLSYQLCLIRDQFDDLNESYRNMQKELSSKKKENAYQKFHVDDLMNRINYLKAEIDIRDKLIVDNNLILLCDTDFSNNTQLNHEENSNALSGNIAGTVLLSKDLIDQLKALEKDSLDSCIHTLFEEQSRFAEEIKALKQKMINENSESEGSVHKDGKKKHNGEDFESLKQNFQNVKSQVQEYKRQLQLSQQKVTSLEADVIRLEGQVKRYKSIAESCEKQEEDLKLSKRKYQKEVREAQSKIEDLKSENASLSKKLDKITKQKPKKEHD